jgi:MYXO-CTERM domain-containing protein
MSPLIALLLATNPAEAFCGAYASSAGTDIYNSVSEVAIVRQGTRTTLTVSNDIEGAAGGSFAMLIPVPEVLSEDDVNVLSHDTFDVLDGYSRPRMVSYTCDDFEPQWEDPCDKERPWEMKAEASMAVADGGGAEDTSTVNVEAEFVVGEYDIVILSAEESDDLFTWLFNEGFQVSDATGEVVQEVIDSGAYFFAAKVSAEAEIEDGALLSPLQFSYDSDVFGLPIRIGTAASKGEQDLIVYAITDFYDGSVGISNYPEMSFEDECMLDGPSFDADHGSDIGAYYQSQFTDAYQAQPGADWMVEYKWGNGHCDPCTGEEPDGQLLSNVGFDFDIGGAGYMVTRLHMRYSPEEATEDLTLYLSGMTDQDQMRFIEYNEDLEWKFPICDVGMVDNPGTCDFENPYPEECGSDDCGCAVTDHASSLGWLGMAGLLGLGIGRRRRQD